MTGKGKDKGERTGQKVKFKISTESAPLGFPRWILKHCHANRDLSEHWTSQEGIPR